MPLGSTSVIICSGAANIKACNSIDHPFIHSKCPQPENRLQLRTFFVLLTAVYRSASDCIICTVPYYKSRRTPQNESLVPPLSLFCSAIINPRWLDFPLAGSYNPQRLLVVSCCAPCRLLERTQNPDPQLDPREGKIAAKQS